jgi:hypothetical protein
LTSVKVGSDRCHGELHDEDGSSDCRAARAAAQVTVAAEARERKRARSGRSEGLCNQCHRRHSFLPIVFFLSFLKPRSLFRLADTWWLMLICSERKLSLTNYSERREKYY